MRLPDPNRFPAACFRHRRRPRENLHRCERCTFPDFFAAYEKNLDALSRLFGGAYWTRTSDPIDVNDVLYQLSQSTMDGFLFLPCASGYAAHSEQYIL